MPKQNRKGNSRSVNVFAVKDSWRTLYAQHVERFSAPVQRNLLNCLNEFLSEGQNQSVQLAGLRKLANVIAKAHENASVLFDTSTLIQDCMLPIALEIHFAPTAPSESSFRSAVFTLIARTNEFYEQGPENERHIVRTRLQNSYDNFLQTMSFRPISESTISHFGAVILTTLERGIGKEIVAKRYIATLTLLVKYLNTIVEEVVESQLANSSTATMMHLTTRLSSCTDLLKITAALLTRYSDDIRIIVMKPGERHDVMQRLLDAAMQICFSKGFLQDNQFMAGFLIAALLDHLEAPGVAASALFGNEEGAANELTLKINIPSAARCWYDEKEWEYAALCLYRGLLTTFTKEKCLVEIPAHHKPLLAILYEKIVPICDQTTDSKTRIVAFQALAGWLHSINIILDPRAKLSAELVAGAGGLVTPDVIDKIFAYVFNGWEDPIDTVQHKLTDVFHGLLDILHVRGEDINADQHIQRMLNGLLKADWHRKVKYDLLSLMLSKVRPKSILALRPDFLVTCFEVMSNVMLASRISAFINKFLKEAFADAPDSEQRTLEENEYWINPVYSALTSPNHAVRKICSENMIYFVLKERNSSLQLLLNALNDTSRVGQSPYRLHATIAVVKAARLLGLMELESFLDENRTLLDQAISHPDTNLRIDVLAFLCETKQATADFSEQELSALKAYLLISLDSQSPDFRQRVQAHLVKLLRRVRRAMYSNWRDYSTRKDYIDECAAVKRSAENLPHMIKVTDDLLRKLILKRDFLAWLCESTATSLFPGCSFQRSSCNLYLMSTILESEDYAIDFNAKVNLADMPSYPTLATPETVQALLAIIFNDTYAPNREKAFELLMRFPAPLPGLEGEDVDRLVRKGIEWVGSVRSHEGDTGATVVRLVFGKYVKGLGKFCGIGMVEKEEGCTMVFFVRQLIGLLKRNIEVAKKNLYLSASGFPMHGLFRALQNVLLEVDFRSSDVLKNMAEWQQAVREIMELIDAACESVLAVCADESPEGNLPASFADMQQNMEDLIAEASDAVNGVNGDKGAEAQLMLYSCFHTIKEMTAVIQALLCQTPLPSSKDDDKATVSYQQIVESGNLLRRLLASIRHRGAFSAVHVCFASVCSTLLSSGKDFLVELPESWLEGFLSQVVSVDVSITRRSAGLPLGVLAIVSAPVPSRKLLLNSALRQLFTIGMQDVPPDANERLDLPQVHAYNVIRAILQDAEIASEVRDHLGEAFALSIKGFSSPSFPIRNCAAMLFSTLISKALGTKKSKDEMHALNTVTGREFFTRFPGLHILLLEELTVAVELLESGGGVHPALYPILTILARLKPSVFEGSSTLMTLSAFRDVVRRCASAGIFKAREMSARAFVALVGSSEVVDCVGEILEEVGSVGQNELHGRLLMVRDLLRGHLGGDAGGKEIRKDAILRVPEMFMSIWHVAEKNKCPVTKTLYLSIITEFFIDAKWVCDESEDGQDLEELSYKSFGQIRKASFNHALQSLPQVVPFMSYMVRRVQATLVLKGLAYATKSIEERTAIVVGLLGDRDYEVQLAVLGFFGKAWRGRERNMFDIGRLNEKMKSLVLDRDVYYQVSQEAAKVLLVLDEISGHEMEDDEEGFADGVLKMLSKETKPHLAQAFLPLLGVQFRRLHAISKHIKSRNTFSTSLIALLQHWSQDEQPLSVRTAVVDSLKQFHLVSSLKQLNEDDLVQMLFLLNRLLQDDDPDVREGCAGIVSGLLGYKEPVTASRCRGLLGMYIAKQGWSSAALSNVLDSFKDMLLGEDDIEILLAQEFASPDVLFAKEAHNSRREELVDMFLASGCLHTLLFRYSEESNISPFMASLRNWAGNTLQHIKKIYEQRAGDMMGLFSRPNVFVAVSRALCIAHLVGDAQGERMIKEVKQMQGLHPGLESMLGGAESEGRKMIRGVCVGIVEYD